MNVDLLLMRNRARLDKMIKDGVPYKRILQQSKKIDDLVRRKIIEMNNKE